MLGNSPEHHLLPVINFVTLRDMRIVVTHFGSLWVISVWKETKSWEKATSLQTHCIQTSVNELQVRLCGSSLTQVDVVCTTNMPGLSYTEFKHFRIILFYLLFNFNNYSVSLGNHTQISAVIFVRMLGRFRIYQDRDHFCKSGKNHLTAVTRMKKIHNI